MEWEEASDWDLEAELTAWKEVMDQESAEWEVALDQDQEAAPTEWEVALKVIYLL